MSDRHKAYLLDLGLTEYRKAHGLQLELVERRRSGRLDADIFLITEHPSVFTLGRRGGQDNLTVSPEFLKQRGIPLIPIERGGNITYHGRGQLVVYPIVHLKSAGLSVAEYVFRLEESMIRLSGEFGVAAVRDGRNHGVWSGGRKLGSVGIAIRHGLAFHGLALNITTDLAPFSWMNPCGMAGVGMTSLARELGTDLSFTEVKERMEGHLAEVFVRRFVPADFEMTRT